MNDHLASCIATILERWRKGLVIDSSTVSGAYGLRKAVEDQSKIGWENFIFGQWSKKWQLVQSAYLLAIKSKQSPKRWTIAIICKLILLCWDVWDFCNKLIHRKGGYYARLHNNSLSLSIRKEFQLGGKNLLPNDKYHFYKYSLYSVLNYPIL